MNRADLRRELAAYLKRTNAPPIRAPYRKPPPLYVREPPPEIQPEHKRRLRKCSGCDEGILSKKPDDETAYCLNCARKISPEMGVDVRRMRSEGLTWVEIGKRLDVSDTTARAAAKLPAPGGVTEDAA